LKADYLATPHVKSKQYYNTGSNVAAENMELKHQIRILSIDLQEQRDKNKQFTHFLNPFPGKFQQ
jgi:hypothetical protein